MLEDGAIFAFGLSEKEHGADIYSTDMLLTPDGDGFRANGGKYYIGNGNVAGMVSVFGRRTDVEGPEGYVFFAADSGHPALPPRPERGRVADVRERVPARGLSRLTATTSSTRGRPPSRRR